MCAENHKLYFLSKKILLLAHWALIVRQLWSLIGLLVSTQQFCYSNPWLRPALTVSLLRWCLIESNCSVKLILTNKSSECNKSSYILISPPLNILFYLKILVNTCFLREYLFNSIDRMIYFTYTSRFIYCIGSFARTNQFRIFLTLFS